MDPIRYDARLTFRQLCDALKKGKIVQVKTLSDELISFNDTYILDLLTNAQRERLEEFRAAAVAD